MVDARRVSSPGLPRHSGRRTAGGTASRAVASVPWTPWHHATPGTRTGAPGPASRRRRAHRAHRRRGWRVDKRSLRGQPLVARMGRFASLSALDKISLAGRFAVVVSLRPHVPPRSRRDTTAEAAALASGPSGHALDGHPGPRVFCFPQDDSFLGGFSAEAQNSRRHARRSTPNRRR